MGSVFVAANNAQHSLPSVAGTPNPLARFCRPCARRYKLLRVLMNRIASFLLLLFTANSVACDKEADSSIEPFLSYKYSSSETESCSLVNLYVPERLNNQSLSSISYKFGKGQKNEVPVMFFDPTEIEGIEGIEKPGYVLAQLCLTQESLQLSAITLIYKPEAEPNGAIAFCMSAKDYQLKELNNL